MKYTLGKKEKGKITIKFDIDAAEWEGYVEAAYQKDKGKYKKEGFRQGKVPRKVLEGTFGKGVFYETAFDICFPTVYTQMMEKEPQLYPIDYPQISVEKMGEDGLKFSATVELLPEVTLGKYTGLEIKTSKPKVLAAEVDAELDRIRERNARFEEISGRAAKMGDVVEINYSGSVAGKKFAGGTAENQELELGSKSFIPGFEEGVCGMNIGDKKDVAVKFPEKYHAQDLAGKDAIFAIDLLSIREKKLPELDDVFAKEVSEQETLAEMKKDIKEKLLAQKKAQIERKEEDDLVKAIVDETKVEIPNAMVERQLDYMVEDFAYRLQYQGMRLEDYLKYIGKTVEDYRKDLRSEAERAVKTNLVIDEIIRKEKIEATDEEAEKHFEEHHADHDHGDKKGKKHVMSEEEKKTMKNHIVSSKLIDFLKKNNKFVASETK